MSTYVQDIRYGLRILRNKPAFTIVTTLVIALGIGVNTAIFSVINSVLLRPLPYHDPEGLVQLWERESQQNKLRRDPGRWRFALLSEPGAGG